MADLTLHDYRDFSEEELRRTLQAEAMTICGNDAVVKKNAVISLYDSGGRRSGNDRRQFSYDIHIPERRRGQDRRSGRDRRNGFDRRKGKELLGATRLQH